MKTLVLTAVAAAALAASAAAAPNPALLHPAKLTAKAPIVFRARFETTKGAFVITVHRAWAPRGADRFYNLVRNGFYDGERLFRVVPRFVVQWGISPYPKVNRAWLNATIKDDPVMRSNVRTMVTFAATGAPNSRTTQIFVNMGQNAFLDTQRFAPFGQVTKGMGTLMDLYKAYGEAPASPQAQQQMTFQGDAFVQKTFPRLDRILSARIVR